MEIPQQLKRQFKNWETDPLVLILEDLPVGVSSIEFAEFFNELLKSLNEKDSKTEPVSWFQIGITQQFAILELRDSESVNKLLQMSPIIYKAYKLYLSRPKGFF